jgi:hypothetical protein
MWDSEGTLYIQKVQQQYKQIHVHYIISTWTNHNNMYVICVIFMGYVNPHMSVIWRPRDIYQEWKRTSPIFLYVNHVQKNTNVEPDYVVIRERVNR